MTSARGSCKASRRIDCPFSCHATLTDGVGWQLEVKNPNHNHNSNLAGAHPAQRRIAMNQHRQEIVRSLSVQTRPSNVLSALRIEDPTPDSIRWDHAGDPVVVNPIFSNRDIYNLQAQLRRDALGPLTPIQALIQEFDKGDWVYEMQTDDQNQITHLFFSKSPTQDLLKDNFEVLIMDCIYKTNRPSKLAKEESPPRIARKTP